MRAPGGCERRIAPGALCCRSGFPPIPAETGQRYFKRSSLTVLLRPQVQNYLLTRLRLILANPMASAIRQFLGSEGASGGTFALARGGLHWRPSARQGMPMAALE